MRQGGQRQDAVYLGVAVGVLVIAFLIIVGARALSPSSSRKKKPSSTAQADAKPTKKPAPKPKADPTRSAPVQSGGDPFLSASMPNPGRQARYGQNRSAYGGPSVSARSGGNGRIDPQPGGQAQPGDPELTLELIGVIQGGSPLAIIRDGDCRYYLRVGDTVGDYRLAKISTNRVVVTRGGKSYTVDLQATRRSNSGSSVRRPMVRPSSRPMRRR